VGMGRALAERHPAAAETLAEADEILAFPLSRLMAEGPEAELTETKNAQPAILAHSVAALRAPGDALVQAAFASVPSLGGCGSRGDAGCLTAARALHPLQHRDGAIARARRTPRTTPHG